MLKAECDLTGVPVETPAPIRRLLRRCLEKDRTRRLDSAAVARLEIDDATRGSRRRDGPSRGIVVPSRDSDSGRGVGECRLAYRDRGGS